MGYLYCWINRAIYDALYENARILAYFKVGRAEDVVKRINDENAETSNLGVIEVIWII